MFSVEPGYEVTMMILAIALGMDAFSLGIGIGLKGIRYWDMIRITAAVALFHMILPLMGMHVGQYASEVLGHIALAAGGGLLSLLGLHMVYSSLMDASVHKVRISSFIGLLVFALTVSIDSFSVGISLGLFTKDVTMTVMTFGVFGGLMSMMGLMLGRKVQRWIGEYGEILGGVILLAFGIKFLLG